MDAASYRDYTVLTDMGLMHELYRRYRCQRQSAQKRILLLGMPGAGKGTHAFKMLQRFCMCHLSTGDLLREEVRSGSEFGKKLKAIMEKGELIDDDTMIGLIQTNLNKQKFIIYLIDRIVRMEPYLMDFQEQYHKLKNQMKFYKDLINPQIKQYIYMHRKKQLQKDWVVDGHI